MNKFVIITALYNVEQWIENAIKSVKAQNYKDFRHIIIDDMSSDNGAQVIKESIENDDRFIFIENTEKKFALGNIYDALASTNIEDEEIIVILDGDDWLACADCLSVINETYNKTNCLLTFGSYKDYPTGFRGKFSKPVSQKIIDIVKAKTGGTIRS